MPNDKNAHSDIEISPRRKRYANRKRLSEVGTALNSSQKDIRAAIYTRVSKEEQVEGHSLGAQRNVCLEFAQKRGWNVVNIYEDPGFSAKDVKRPAFQRMMLDAENNFFDVVLVHKLDRFSRSIADTLSSFKRLDDHKVAFTSATENFDFSSAQGRLFFNMMTVFAQWYLENLSAESVKGKREMFNKGLHNGAAPFGYRKIQETKKIEIVPEEGEAVKMAFELAASDAYTHRMIAEILNRKFRTRRGRNWSKDTVTNMLRNEFYYGMVSFREMIRPGLHEPLITKELFVKAQTSTRNRFARNNKRVLPQHNKKGKPTVGTKYYMLQRIIRCEACDRYLRIQSSRQQKYYKEVSAERGLECKFSARSVQIRVMDRKVIEMLSTLRLPVDWQDEVSRRAQDRDVALIAVKKRSKIEESLRRLDDVYVNGRYTRAEYMVEREKLLNELEVLVMPDNTMAIERGLVLESFGSYFEKATANELSEICRTVLDAVYTDFMNSRITRFKPAAEFMELFRIAAPLSGWKEREDGSFVV